MSLMSILANAGGTSSTTSATTYSNPKVVAAAKLLADYQAGKAAAAETATTTGQDSVSISSAAKIAAAETVDNAKDFTTLSNDTRATIDTQYAAQKAAGSKTAEPDLSQLSGRALAAIVLNKTGAFSPAEISAGKAELNSRARGEFTSAISGGLTTSSMATYSKQLVTEYDGMSAEERQARGLTSATRSSAASFVQHAAETTPTSSLFDLLG